MGIGNGTHAGTATIATDAPKKAEKGNRILTTDLGTDTFRQADAKHEFTPELGRERGP